VWRYDLGTPSYYDGVPKSYLHTEGKATMMEFLFHFSTQRGTSYYDGVPKSYLHTERDKLL
jgi:membrane-bound acyltransferase YfiQ involved in biofilm formation